MIIKIKVLDHELYARYVEKVPEIIKKHGGRYLVRGGEVIPIRENSTITESIVVNGYLPQE